MTDSSEYQKIVTSLKRKKEGATVADICANTALPLSVVQELLPKAADEYSAHLRVTQSGEILYYFPNGFKSRFKGFGAILKKIFKKTVSFTKKALALLFKIWIMVMLIGYFVFFILLTLAIFFLSIAARNNNNDRSDGFGGLRIFDILIRIWFIGEFSRSDREYNFNLPKKNKEKRPLHKGVFSFIFGDEDPNKNWEEQRNRAIISFLQTNSGCISLTEYMSFTGENSLEAEESILSFCSKYGGSPEVTEEGTILYRFDALLKSNNEILYTVSENSVPIQRLKTFSTNSKKMNVWFIIINAVNLIFGSYFLYQSLSAGQLITELQYQSASYFYAIVHAVMDIFISNPHILIGLVLGLVPFLFSVLFWIIPLIRYFLEKKQNQNIKINNFKRFSFNKIWSKPLNIQIESLTPVSDECIPDNLTDAQERVIKDIGAYSSPEILINDEGKTVYSFDKLKKEKEALEKYRININLEQYKIGNIVFDSNE
ncbi:MAG: hypothetical protein FWB86_09740 [Treponema sp.]|nr:hypothetical protein [Treponema sp.]MCL2252279.1 hypothetical protein [Treponema sp.]